MRCRSRWKSAQQPSLSPKQLAICASWQPPAGVETEGRRIEGGKARSGEGRWKIVGGSERAGGAVFISQQAVGMTTRGRVGTGGRSC